MFMSQTQLFQEQKVSGIRSVTSLNGLKEASVLNKGTHNAQIAKIRKKCSIRGSHWSVLTSKGPSKLRKAEKSFFKGSFLGFNNTVAHQNYSTQRSQISLVLLLGHYVSIHSTTFLIQMFRSQFFFKNNVRIPSKWTFHPNRLQWLPPPVIIRWSELTLRLFWNRVGILGIFSGEITVNTEKKSFTIDYKNLHKRSIGM